MGGHLSLHTADRVRHVDAKRNYKDARVRMPQIDQALSATALQSCIPVSDLKLNMYLDIDNNLKMGIEDVRQDDLYASC